MCPGLLESNWYINFWDIFHIYDTLVIVAIRILTFWSLSQHDHRPTHLQLVQIHQFSLSRPKLSISSSSSSPLLLILIISIIVIQCASVKKMGAAWWLSLYATPTTYPPVWLFSTDVSFQMCPQSVSIVGHHFRFEGASLTPQTFRCQIWRRAVLLLHFARS